MTWRGTVRRRAASAGTTPAGPPADRDAAGVPTEETPAADRDTPATPAGQARPAASAQPASGPRPVDTRASDVPVPEHRRTVGPLGLRLVAAVPRDAHPIRLAGGERIVIRAAGPGDRAAAGALHERCSPDTLSMRYHGVVADADRYLTHLLDPRHGRTLAVEDDAGRLIALGHLLWDGEESELALLVEDSWQRRGVGTLLLRRLVALARAERRASVYAVTRAANTAMHAAMRGLGLPLERHSEDGTLVLTASVTGPADGTGEMPAATVRK